MKYPPFSFTVPFVAPILLGLCWMVVAGQINNQIILPPINQVFDVMAHPFRDLISMGSLVRAM